MLKGGSDRPVCQSSIRLRCLLQLISFPRCVVWCSATTFLYSSSGASLVHTYARDSGQLPSLSGRSTRAGQPAVSGSPHRAAAGDPSMHACGLACKRRTSSRSCCAACPCFSSPTAGSNGRTMGSGAFCGGGLWHARFRDRFAPENQRRTGILSEAPTWPTRREAGRSAPAGPPTCGRGAEITGADTSRLLPSITAQTSSSAFSDPPRQARPTAHANRTSRRHLPAS